MERKYIRITVEEAPRLHFRLNLMIPEAPNDYPPDCIVEECDLILVKVGQVLDGTSNHYRYRRASVELFDWRSEVEDCLPEPQDDTPSLDTSFHDIEMAVDDDPIDPESDSYCPNSENHLHDWPRVEEHERCLCMYCGADGDA